MAITKVERNEAEEFDINDPSLIEGEATELDLAEDFQAKAPPPPGRLAQDKPRLYKIRFHFDAPMERTLKTGFKKDDPNGYFYTNQLTGKIIDPNGTWDNAVVYYKVSSFIERGKKLSKMAGFLQMVRIKVPTSISELALAKLLPKAMEALDRKEGPILIGDCDWSCWDKEAKKRGSEIGALLKEGMYNFPKKADGGYQHILIGAKGNECYTKLKVNRIMPLVAPKEANGAVKEAVKPVAAIKPAPVQENLIQDGGVVLGEDGDVVLDLS